MIDLDGIHLHHGDCIEVMKTMPANSVDSIVTDPPYGLEFMGKEWDSFVPSGRRRREWDGRRRDDDSAKWEPSVRDRGDGKPGGPAFSNSAHYKPNTKCLTCGLWQFDKNPCRCETPDYEYRIRHEAPTQMLAFGEWCRLWATEALRILKPGGHAAVFGGTRTYHRLTCGLEDAGFEIRDTLAWLYGSGFPKSLDVSKSIDRQRHDGADVERVRRYLHAARNRSGITTRHVADVFGVDTRMVLKWMGDRDDPQRHCPTWDQWLALKTLLGTGDEMDAEVWRLNGRKGTPGEAWHDRAVIGERDVPNGHAFAGPVYGGDSSSRRVDLTAPATPDAERWNGWGTALKPAHEPITLARKPLTSTVAANVLEHGTGALNIDACRITTTDRWEATGRQSAPSVALAGGADGSLNVSVSETHPAGRWPANVILDTESARALDAQTGERASAYPGRPDLAAEKVGRPTIARGVTSIPANMTGLSYADTGGASRFFYTAKASSAERSNPDGTRTQHPTVKPLDLMRWLCRLITPPGGVILDPFAGSGTTLQAARMEGFRAIGIEQDADSVQDCISRLSQLQIGLE